MSTNDEPLISSIDSELVGLRKKATSAAEVLREHREISATARVAFRADPSDATLRAMWRSAMRADSTYHALLEAEEALDTVLGFRQLVMLTIRDHQPEGDSE